MRHVLLETNWVVDLLAPAHHQVQAAADLLNDATNGKLALHLPALCIQEARRVLERPRFKPQAEANAMRQYLRWALQEGALQADDVAIARTVVDGMERRLRAEHDALPRRLASLRSATGVEVFGLTEAMLERSIDIASEDIYLKPMDQSILSAVLVKGTELAAQHRGSVCFATLDKNLRPWDKHGNSRHPLVDWYDDAEIWVFSDFTLTWPAPP